jgi:hypothetical protein
MVMQRMVLNPRLTHPDDNADATANKVLPAEIMGLLILDVDTFYNVSIRS